MINHCLVLSLRDFGENSLIVTLLHPHLGRLECLAKGGKNIGAKLTPSLQPLFLVNLWLAPTKGELPTIQEVEAIRSYLPMENYLALKFSLHSALLLEKVAHPFLESKDLLKGSLEILRIICTKRLPVSELKKLWIQFELSILSYLGVKPETKSIRAYDLDRLAHILEKRIYHHL